MKVILQQDVKKLGNKGDVIEVSEGYGRNYLLPRNLAIPATAANLNEAKVRAGAKARKKAQAADEAKLMARQLENVEVTVPVRIGEGGRLFGSVTGRDVATALAKKGIDVDRKKIALQGQIVGEGLYEAVIKIHPDVQGKIRVRIVAE